MARAFRFPPQHTRSGWSFERIRARTDYAALGNEAVQTFLTSGMWCVEAPIAFTDLEGYGSTNQMQVNFEHVGSSGPRYASYAIRHFD